MTHKVYTLTSEHPSGIELTHTTTRVPEGASISDRDLQWFAQIAWEVGKIYPEATVKVEIRTVEG